MSRPCLWENPEDLQVLIAEYFDEIDQYNEKNPDYPRPYTMSGLAYALGCDRKTIVNYGKKEPFFHTIKRARAKVERFIEEQLFRSGQVAGPIFNLKNNFGWLDKPSDSEDAQDQDFSDAIE